MTKPKLKRLTMTFNRATLKQGEHFEVMLPSSERDGLEWTLNDPMGQLTTVSSKAQPAWEPRSRTLTLYASQKGAINFEIALKRPEDKKSKQVYKFKVLVK